MRNRTPKLLAFVLAAVMTMGMTVSAATIEENPAGQKTNVNSGDTMQNNNGIVMYNRGEVINNNSVVQYNRGKVQNNNAGRIAFWNDIITYDRQLSALGAIEDVVAEEVKVELGSDKKSVAVTNPITPVCAMSKLYMTVIVQ